MRFIGLADLHLSLYAQDNIIKGLPARLYYLNQVLRNTGEYASDKNINTIVIAGDTLHNKSIIHSMAQSIFLEYVRNYPDLVFIIIDGNHDMSSKSGNGVSALKSLDNEPNVIMIHKPKMIENVFFVPWNPETMVDDIKNNKADYLVSHFGLNEAILSSGISIVSDLKLSDLSHYKKCFLGHYHKPQEVGNTIYIGSPIQLDLGEKGEEKRFLIVDTENGEIESVPTTGYKKYIEFEINNENKEVIIEKARKAQENGDYVQLIKYEDMDIDNINKEFKIVDKSEVDITERGIISSMSQSERLHRYMEIKKIKKEDIEDYEKVGIDIINSCVDI